MCAPKIGAAPLPGQALLPKKTLRRKVTLGKHYVRWANVCQAKANELTDVLKAPGLRTLEIDDAIFALSSRAVSKPGGENTSEFPPGSTPLFKISRSQNRGIVPTD
jgi:hypothetical protein